jgi:hypothetical protein
MTSKYRFFSDTNLKNFEEDLFRVNASFSTVGHTVNVHGVVPGFIEEIALSLGGQLIEDALDYSSTSGLDGSGFHDMQSTAIRSSPPDAIRGQAVPDYSAQISSQQPGGFPVRRKTRGQP